ncbi:hypothetical protein B5M42_000315 [Paenibacillus athensensis]|uniref:HTH luxR-type domain-containing protein n=1 Tax=Paenibacillus athensensis TaxID=1967502 RepID=A0A4Y8Q9G0_9BACL|nr:LuxR C-terminal-related transcriptional regulator [Paenibacillus athensensis]MCD1257278.1 hypothetical protein [Paenibacillus athensensis]
MHLWRSLSDVEPHLVFGWQTEAESVKLPFAVKLNGEALRQARQPLDLALSAVRQELEEIRRFIFQPHLFIFTNAQGIALVAYDQGLLASGAGDEELIGCSFDVRHAGMTAIGLAMKLQTICVVDGREHTWDMLWDLSCVCTPITVNGAVTGYLNFSFPRPFDLTFSIPLLKQLARNIEGAIVRSHPETQRDRTYALFTQFELTEREKQIGYAWLRNDCVEHIANACSISEQTVRTHIKNIYSKTKTTSKGEFFNKFVY